MDAMVRGFLLDRQSRGYTDKTIRWHEAAMKRFYNWLETNKLPTEPTSWSALTLREYIVFLQTTNSKRGKPFAGATVTNAAESLLAYCRWLYEEELIDKDITKRVKKPAPPQEQKQPFTEYECRALLFTSQKTSHGRRDHAIMCVLLDCGLRATELTNLCIDDVLLDQHLIQVRQGKGKKDRVVPLSLETAKAINRYIVKDRSKIEDSSGNLFLSERGGALQWSGLRRIIERVALQAGVKDAYAHRFRHTFALMFLRNGGDALTLQRILGHTTLDMTRKYVNMQSDDLVRSHSSASPLSNLK